VLSPGLLVVHDTGRGGEDDLTERSGGEEQVDPVLDCNVSQELIKLWWINILESTETLNLGEMTPALFNRPLS
jgi:hypothetical protein